MGFLSGIFGQQPAQQQPAQPPQPVAGNQQSPAAAQPTGSPPPSQQQQPANPNPMDAFMQLMTPKAGEQQLQQRDQQTGLFPETDPAQLQQQIKSANFTAGLDQAQVQAALSGDQTAFMSVLNAVAQNAFSSSLQMSRGLVEMGVNTGSDRINSSLEQKFRDFMLKQQAPKTDNPALQHPIGRNFHSAIARQIAAANPQMSPEQVAQQAEQQLLMFAQQLAPQQPTPQQQAASKTMDWDSFAAD
jgi:hypothetical protein